MLSYNELIKLSEYELMKIYQSSADNSYKAIVKKALLAVQGLNIFNGLVPGANR
ncbi:hypothetical protein ACVWU4_000981 [Campylobacter coli]